MCVCYIEMFYVLYSALRSDRSHLTPGRKPISLSYEVQRVSLQASPIHQTCRVLIAQSPDHNILAISVSLVHEERCLSGMLIVGWQ